MYSAGTEVLIEKRQQLLDEKNRMVENFDSQIREVESCIELLEGKKVWEISTEVRYEDENPNHIRSSQEKM